MELGVGSIHFWAGSEEPLQIERRGRHRPCPGRLVLRHGLLLSLRGGEQAVVADVLGEAVLQCEDAVFAHSGTDVGTVDYLVDTCRSERSAVADTGQLE